jgi:carbon storage regulator
LLVLTRHANQSIMIGHDIVVTVLEVRGDQVRLGINAPKSIQVHREEVFVALQQANREAVSPSPAQLGSLEEISRSVPVRHVPDDRDPLAPADRRRPAEGVGKPGGSGTGRRPEIGDSRPG